jgi:hypothetical protein
MATISGIMELVEETKAEGGNVGYTKTVGCIIETIRGGDDEGREAAGGGGVKGVGGITELYVMKEGGVHGQVSVEKMEEGGVGGEEVGGTKWRLGGHDPAFRKVVLKLTKDFLKLGG